MPRRLRPTPLEHVVDGHALRARLSAAALDSLGDEAAQRARAIEILKQALFRGRMIAKERLENGAGGLETSRLLSGVTDEVITALYDFTTVHVFRARNPTEGERLCLLAVGGYGRRTLAPFSDIDLLFLRPYKTTPHAESVIEFMLYALWDLGFKVGHASRTIEECVRLSKEDFTIRTSILEARRLTGDERLANDLKKRFRDDVMKGTGAQFVAAKLKERDDRQARAGTSRYMVEPNVKEGKGGLRDLHTLMWIAEYLHPVDRPEDVFKMEVFSTRETKAFIRAFDFLHAVRAHLHFTTGRPEERLTFDLQPEIARRMGYGDRGDAPAVERFMRRYFLIAKEVGALTRAFSAKLEAEHFKNEPKGISRFLPGGGRPKRKALDVDGFYEDGGRLNIDGPEVFEADPVNLIRLFKIADERDLDLHPDAFTAVTRSLALITSRVRRDEDACAAFLHLLARGKRSYRTLTLMNDAGVLGRFVPEFGRIVAQEVAHLVHVGLSQRRRIAGVFHEVFELIQVGQILHGLHGLLESHRLLTREVVLLIPPSLGKHALQVLRQLIHLPTQVHVFKQLFRKLLQLCTLLWSHAVQHGLSHCHALCHVLKQFVERLRILWKEITEIFHELFELGVLAIFATFQHVV